MFGATLLLLLQSRGALPPPVARSRDYDIMAEIQRLLTATGAFAAVHLHGPQEYPEDGADLDVIAFVEQIGWEEDSDADDENTVRERRDVTWRLVVNVKDENPVRRYQRLSTLAELACNTLNGVSYLGQTVRPLSRLTRAAYSEASHPYREIQMDGRFTTLIDGYTGHDDDDDDIDLIFP